MIRRSCTHDAAITCACCCSACTPCARVICLQEAADTLNNLTVQRQLEEHRILGTSRTRLPTPHPAYAYQGRDPRLMRDRVRVGSCHISYMCEEVWVFEVALLVLC